MASNESIYPAFLLASIGGSRDHHVIFVELDTKGGTSWSYEVEGDVQNGMRYTAKAAKSPLDSVTFIARHRVGWVPSGSYGYIDAVCSSIPPLPKQYEGGKCLVPKHKLRRCQEWTRDAINMLKHQNVIQGDEGKWETRADLEFRGKSQMATSSS